MPRGRGEKSEEDKRGFPQFSRLPTEIRLLIWEYALFPRAAHFDFVGASRRPGYAPPRHNRVCHGGVEPRPLFGLHKNVSSLFLATRESRAVATKNRQVKIADYIPGTVAVEVYDVVFRVETIAAFRFRHEQKLGKYTSLGSPWIMDKPPRQYSVATHLPTGQDPRPLSEWSNMINEGFLAQYWDVMRELSWGGMRNEQWGEAVVIFTPQFIETATKPTIEPVDNDAKQQKAVTTGPIAVGGATFRAGALVDTRDGVAGGKQGVKDQKEEWALTKMTDCPFVKAIARTNAVYRSRYEGMYVASGRHSG